MCNTGLKRLAQLISVSDEQAMWRVQHQDDEQAFALLVKRWQTPIYRLCVRMINDEHRAEDLAQEVFLRLFSHRQSYRPEARFSTYLWRIALNLCHDELRRVQRRRESSLADPLPEHQEAVADWNPPAPQPDAALTAQEEARHVRDALAKLPEIYRSVLLLRHFENLKFREIATVLDLPEGTVKSRMVEALNQLARLLGHPDTPTLSNNPPSDSPSCNL